MSLSIYNTLSRKKEIFKPLKQDEVKIYYCGPTPYNYAHIGNLRNYLMDDFVVRSMRFLGYKVKSSMCITDIDDKTIRDSQKSGKSLKEFTEYYTREFLSDCDKLSIIPADNIKPISELIDDMGEIIDGLIKKGYAYIAEDWSIYYSVAKFKNYGNLAHLDFKGMISSVRIDNDEYDKEQAADFALWKAYDPESDGENKWEIEISIPWSDDMRLQNGSNSSENRGPQWVIQSTTTNEETEIWAWKTKFSRRILGRPGWHIECSACNRHFFWDQIDIHMGGVDLVFPHHQNEIAQTEAFTGKTFAKYWLHGGHLLVDNKKMAKSAKNFYTLRDILEKNDTLSQELTCRGFRLMALQNQYAESFNFTFDRLEAAINTVRWLDEMVKRLGRYIEKAPAINDERNTRGKLKFHDISREFRDNQQAFMQDFLEKLEDNFDTNSAMTIVWEYQSYINSGIDEVIFSLEEAKSLVDLLRSWDQVIAILDFTLLESENIPENISKLAEARSLAKNLKDWKEADSLRDQIVSLGWKMIDEADGKWRVEKV